MLPPMTSTPRKVALDPADALDHALRCGRARCRRRARRRRRATSSSARSSVPSPTPTAAPTRSLPWASRAALGKLVCLVMSLTVIRPRSSKASLTTITRSSLSLVHQRLAVGQRRALAHRDQALARRHDLAHRRVEPRFETQVTVGDDADDGLALHAPESPRRRAPWTARSPRAPTSRARP